MNLSNLISGDDQERAVSPVIGVILMVAITVILAAVIASFVLGLGDSQEVAPTATFDFNFDSDDGDLTITHTGGDNIRVDQLYIRGNTELQSSNQGQWNVDGGGGGLGGDASAGIDSISAVSSGDSVELGSSDNVGSGYVVRVVWESSEGTSSSELATDSGPDA